MSDKTISSLPPAGGLLPDDELALVSYGQTVRAKLVAIRDALPTATSSDKGLLSAADKVELQTLRAQIDVLLARPLTATVASAPIISIPNGADVLTLTGSTNITAIEDAEDFHTYVFYYPTGPGITVLGTPMAAQDVLVMVYTPPL